MADDMKNRHICSLSKIPYSGTCPIKECWHNAEAAVGGCVLNLNRPMEMDDLTILRMLVHPESAIESAKETLSFIMEMRTYYQQWSGKPGCVLCGKYWPGGVVCSNPRRCAERSDVIEIFREHKLWNALNADMLPKTVLWDFLSSEERIHGLARILGLNPSEIIGEKYANA